MLLLLALLSFDHLAAVVGNEPITYREVKSLENLYPGKDEKELLDKMIMDRIILKAAKEETLTVTEEEIQAEKSRLVSNIPELASVLREPYIDSLYTEELRIQLYTRKLIQNKFQTRMYVSPVEVKEFYEANRDSFRIPASVHLERLQIPVIQEENNKVYQRAERILEKYRDGVDFAELAREYSEDQSTKYIGGKLGSFRVTDLPQYLSGVLQMDEGEADIFKSPGGYHVVLLRVKKGEQISLSHVFLGFRFSEEEIRQGRNRAERIGENWESGDSLEEYSVMDMGVVPLRNLNEPLYSIIDTTEAGEVTPPALEADAFYLFRVKERERERIPPFDEIKDRIRGMLMQHKTEKLLKEWAEEEKNHIYVKRYSL